MTTGTEARTEGQSAGVAWQPFRGRLATVYAPRGGYAARRAQAELQAVERMVEALQRLLDPPPDRRGQPIEVYVVDAVDERARLARSEAAPDAPAGRPSLVQVVAPEIPRDALAEPLTRTLLGRWFGPGAASSELFVQGIAGLAAARAGMGPPVEDADRWVLGELEAGRPASVVGGRRHSRQGRGASGDAAPPQEVRHAAVSFVAHLAANAGASALRSFLASLDPDRPDEAALAAFRQPMGVLEEQWLTALRHRATGEDALRSLLGRVLPLLRPYRLRQLEILLYLALASGLNVVTPLFTGWLVENFRNPALRALLGARLLWMLPALAGVYVLSGLVSLRRAQAVAWLNQQVLNDLQERLFSHLQRLPHSFYNRAKIGDLMARLTTDVESIQSALSQVTNKGLYHAFTLAGGVLALFYASKGNLILATALILVIFPLFASSYAGLRSRNKQASREQRRRVGQTAAMTQEILSAHPVVKAFRMEARAVADFRERLRQQQRAKLRLATLSALTDLTEDGALMVAYLVTFGLGGYLALTGRGLDAGAVVATLMLVKPILGSIASLSGIGQTVQQASGALDRVNELFEEPVTIEDPPHPVELRPLSRAIQLDRVTFSYDGEMPVLRGLSLEIPAGIHAAIVGPSGSGKTTVTNLLMRFWDPDEGRVLFDGVDIRTASLASLRGQMAIVFQDTFVFDTTVRENIRIGRPDATEEEVRAAARAARLESAIQAMPAGYDTVLGERGVRMSGGQRQRLAIARAVLADPRILILDEATSALDARTEAELMETLLEVARGRTTVSVTHRLSWAQTADLILVLEGGRLVEQGSHASLLAAGGLYARLCEEQMGPALPRGAPGVEVSRLADVPLFRGLDSHGLEAVAAQLRPERYESDAAVVTQGEPGDRLYIIASGSVEIVVSSGAGERRINTLGEGEYFGEMALLTDAPRAATVRTITRTLLYSLTREDFAALLAREPTIAAAVSATVAERQSFLAQACAAGDR